VTDEIVVEGEGTELALRDPQPVTLFRTDDPAEVVQRATQTANALMDAIKTHDAAQTDSKKRLISNISGREFPKVECWTLLGTMLGVFPVCEWSRAIEGGFEARVVAQTLDGRIVGSAEAQCTRSESNWKSRDDYALRSMAQTRATSKALSVPLRFIMTLAGLEGTPAEEMPSETPVRGRQSRSNATPAQGEGEKKVAAPRGLRMRQKIEQLAQDGDKQREATPGTTWAEVCDVIAWRHKPENYPPENPEDYGASWDELTDAGCEWLGQQLSMWLAANSGMTFLEHVVVPF
jgi:hypothetical protein